MPADETFDVAVAGAGAAGSAAALALQRAGWRVCLLDTPPLPGPRVGESLPGAARRLLRQLGIEGGLAELLPAQSFAPCPANASAWGSAHWTYQDALRNPEGGGWHLDRAAFDTALRTRAQAAGAMWHPCRLAGVEPAPATGGYHLQLQDAAGAVGPSITARHLIDATGRRAWLARRTSSWN